MTIRQFGVLLLVLLGVFIATTPDMGRTSHSFAAENMEASTGWRSIKSSRYDNGHALRSLKPGDSLSIQMSDRTRADRISLRVYNFAEGRNIFELSGGTARQTITQEGGSVGVVQLESALGELTSADELTLLVQDIGQKGLILDTITFSSVGTHWARIGARAALAVLLALSIWLAVRMSAPPQTSSGRIYTSIDNLRGIGILLVFFLHATGFSGLPDLSAQPFLDRVSKGGHFGVEIFYVVSAYTLTFSLNSALRRDRDNIISTFWNRRVNRILPPFLVVVMVGLFYNFAFAGSLDGSDLAPLLIRFATMTYIFDREVLVSALDHSVLWSISTEFQFYLLMPVVALPMVAFLLRKNTPTSYRWTAAALFIGGIVATAWSRGLLSEKAWLNKTLFYHLDAFLIGIAIALLVLAKRQVLARRAADTSDDHSGEPVIDARARRAYELIAALSFAAVCLAVAYSVLGAQVLSSLGLGPSVRPNRLFVLLVCAAVVLITEYCERKGARMAWSQPLRAIGLLSYVLYLVHIPALQIVQAFDFPSVLGTEGDRYAATVSLGLAVSIIMAVLLHQFVEKPSQRLNTLGLESGRIRAFTNGYVIVVAVCLLAYLGAG